MKPGQAAALGSTSGSMANKSRAQDEAWANAKKICRLTRRQIEMARALGMNPRKLPRLRPSPEQRWKVPVGEFIEECYRKRFGGAAGDQQARGAGPQSRQPSIRVPALRTARRGVPTPAREPSEPERVRDLACQFSDLACYLVNLADDVQQWLAHGSIDPEVLAQVGEELREIANALDTGAQISPIPAIPPPLRPTRRQLSRRGDQEHAFDDDEIPF